MEAEFEKAARALGIDWGPAKGDMIFGEDGKPYVIEIAARLSGGNFCYDKVPWSTGVDIVDILVDMAVGNPVDPARFTPTRNLATSQRYFFPAAGTIRQIEGVDGGAKPAAYPQGGCLGAARRNHRGGGKPSLAGRLCHFLRARRAQEAVAAAGRRRGAQLQFRVEA